MNAFKDNLHAVLTARSGRVPFAELYQIVHEVLRASAQAPANESMSPRIIVSRWLSEGFIEADIASEMFVLCRPTLSMVKEGRWVLTGAKSTGVELRVAEYLDPHTPAFVPSYAPPKRFYRSKASDVTAQQIESIVAAGANVVGDGNTPAWRVHLKGCPAVGNFINGEPAGEMDRRAWLYQSRRWRVSPKDFSITKDVEVGGQVQPGAFVCTNLNPKFDDFLFIALSRKNQAYKFEDWRWLYVWLLSEFWDELSPFFYNPKTRSFGVFLLPNFKSRLDNWLPKEVSTLLGSCCFSESMSQREIQDVDESRLKPCIIYPEVPRELAEEVHKLLGFTNKHPLRYLFY
jgi:hypothetical protein